METQSVDPRVQTQLMEVLSDFNSLLEIQERIYGVFKNQKGNPELAKTSSRTMCLDFASTENYADLKRHAERWRQNLLASGRVQEMDQAFMGRNDWVSELIADLAIPGSLLDQDTGDSFVAHRIQELRPDLKIWTTDSQDLRVRRNLPFDLYSYNEKKLPFEDGYFDQCLMATVLHHCDQVDSCFHEVVRTVRPEGQILLFENVFEEGDSKEQGINVFFDWFFNHVVHESTLEIPCSHRSTQEWMRLLLQSGYTQITCTALGRHVAIPLEHVLFTARKT